MQTLFIHSSLTQSWSHTHMANAILLLITLLSITHLPSFSIQLPSNDNNVVNNRGFTTELIRRNSPKSPLSFNSATIPPKAIPRSRSSISPDDGEFLMKLSIGTPPRDVFVIFDTGSDLFWVQCLPCASCYKQIKPYFDPTKSSSYRNVSCRSNQCKFMDFESYSCSSLKTCDYVYGYGSGMTEGSLGTETVALNSFSGETVSFEKVVFGCGHENRGTFSQSEMGLIGLGRGPASFISQVGPSLGGKKFSYCLMPYNTNPNISSTITFGSGSEVVGPNVTTLTLTHVPDPTFYSLTLTGISVNKTFIPYNNSSKPVEKGNVILDSGTPYTLFPEDFYDRVSAEVKRQIRSPPVIKNETFCYTTGERFSPPPITLHFDGGEMLWLSKDQSFIEEKKGLFCFGMAWYSDNMGIIGNYAQANFLVGYDLEKMTVSFKPTDCTKYG